MSDRQATYQVTVHGRISATCFAAIIGALSLVLPAPSRADPTMLGSDAEVWLQQTPAEKAAYLDGLCTGLQAGKQLAGELLCASNPTAAQLRAQGKIRPGLRFCAVRFNRTDDNRRQLPTGTEILDGFYASAAHSDVPVVLAVEQYNDKACGEDNVGRRIAAAQAGRKCVRQLVNMRDASPEAKAAQQAVCDRLK